MKRNIFYGSFAILIFSWVCFLFINKKPQNSIEGEWITSDIQQLGLHGGDSVAWKFKNGLLESTVTFADEPVTDKVKYIEGHGILHILSDTTYNHYNDPYYEYTIEREGLILTGISRSSKGEKIYFYRK